MATESVSSTASLRQEKRYHLFSVPGYILFFVILFLPVSQNTLMGWLIAITASLIMIGFLFGMKTLRLNRTIFLWIIFYTLLGVSYAMLGLRNDNPGARFTTLVFVVWPIVYVLFISAGCNARILTNLLRIMVIATIAVGLATIDYALWFDGVLPDYLYLNVGVNMTANSGYTVMALYNLSSLVFLVPFLLTALMVYSGGTRPFIAKKWLWLALIVGLFGVLLGGRRALLLVTLVAPFIAVLFISWLPGKFGLSRKLRLFASTLGLIIVLLFSGLVISMAFDWNWHGVTKMFLEGFDFQTDDSAVARAEQYNALVDGWKQHPVFGAGLGATTDYVRSDDRPWEYELQYILLLFDTGIVGFILYSAGIIWIYRTAYKLIRSGTRMSNHMVPIMVGTTCFLIANATNPYLQTFGHIWTIFLPIGFINYWMLTHDREDASVALLEADASWREGANAV